MSFEQHEHEKEGKGEREREVFGEDEEGRDGEADQRRRLRIRNRQESRHGFSDPPQHAHVPRFAPIYKQIRIRVSCFQLGLMERVFVLNVVDCPFGTRIAEPKVRLINLGSPFAEIKLYDLVLSNWKLVNRTSFRRSIQFLN